ncbi:MAG: nitrilase-related carbon-nitrogen hydrolase, partial [Cyanobacteria bacterium J06642_9]
MPRMLTVGAAQLGPIACDEPRATIVQRLMALMHQAHTRGCDLVVYPELALTTFFPRWYMEDPAEIDQFFEFEMPNAATQPLFDLAQQLGVGFHLGYAERVVEQGEVNHYNTAILVDQTGQIIGKYRKIHLPGHAEHEPWRAFQHLEKRYFEVGNNLPGLIDQNRGVVVVDFALFYNPFGVTQ